MAGGFVVGGAGATALEKKEGGEGARPERMYQAYAETGFSFPSGHATLAASFYGFLIYLLWPMMPAGVPPPPPPCAPHPRRHHAPHEVYEKTVEGRGKRRMPARERKTRFCVRLESDVRPRAAYELFEQKRRSSRAEDGNSKTDGIRNLTAEHEKYPDAKPEPEYKNSAAKLGDADEGKCRRDVAIREEILKRLRVESPDELRHESGR